MVGNHGEEPDVAGGGWEVIYRYKIYYSEDRTHVSQFPYGISPAYKLDPETGLPELGEGEYFKVTSAAINGWLRVHYMRKRTWWFDKSLAYTIIPADDRDIVTPHDILWYALGALEKYEKGLAEKAEPKEPKPPKAPKPPKPVKVEPVDNTHWYGKYPPKTLKERPNGVQ